MITNMKKYTFLVFHRDYEAFLSSIRELGVVHIDMKAQGLAENEQMQQALEKADALRHLMAQKATDEQIKAKNQLLSQIADIDRELARLAPLGNYSADMLEKLHKAGYDLRVYSCAKTKYNEEWGTILSESGATVYFAALMPIENDALTEFSLGEKAPVELRVEKESLCSQLAELEAESQSWWQANQARLEGELHEAEQNVDWTKVVLNTNSLADGALCLVEGFVPEGTWDALNDALRKQDVYFEVADPVEEDQTPIQLRNNKFTRIFESLTGMYGWPSYGEFDPTPVLAPFYLLFFAMCMGDLGYGVILVIYGLLQSKKIVNIGMFDGLGPIITALGVATTVVGFFMGTAFGVDLYHAEWYPEALKPIILAYAWGDEAGKVLGYDFWMVGAIAIGVFHLCFAMVVKAICYTARFGFRENVSTWGWLLLIVGTLLLLLAGMIFGLPMDVIKYVIYVIAAIACLGIFIFNTPGRNPLMNIGAGLWDTYNMATGLLGDVLSYIRLYALGLAGGMLGGAFNNLAIDMVWGGGEGSIAAVVGKGLGMVLILLLGHVLNLLMACLGAFVHPLRLTFVEYFKNSGYEGKGPKYNPFCK